DVRPFLCCLCFSQYSAAYRDLLSFPTRRSSDLRSVATADGGGSSPHSASTRASIVTTVLRLASSSASAARWFRLPSGRASPSSRSEEHTSELQSRENLVCRLLLEKKKTKYTTA